MDNVELDFNNDQIFSCLDMTNAQSSCSFDIEEFLGRTQSCGDVHGQTDSCSDVLGQTQECTHAHACDPSGPDKSHTHTCIHVHTKILPTPNESEAPSHDTTESMENKDKNRPVGNREAVRKYREKKKAKTASLEDEVARLRALNQHLMKRLQNQSLLEAEVARLKCLLVDIRGRIDGELGAFPYQKPTKNEHSHQNISNPNLGSYEMNRCNVQGSDMLNCLSPGSDAAFIEQGLGDCGFDNFQCLRGQDFGSKGFPDRGNVNDNISGAYVGNISGSRKRGVRAAMGRTGAS